jgi:hypothetical protein
VDAADDDDDCSWSSFVASFPSSFAAAGSGGFAFTVTTTVLSLSEREILSESGSDS